MDGLKDSKQAVGAATLTAVNELWPPTILAEASRLNFSTRLFNLLVTNIPGRRCRCTCSAASSRICSRSGFLPKNHALAVAIMSYNGGLDYGLLGDYDALPDIDVIAEGIDVSLKDLLDAAARARTRTPDSGGTNGGTNGGSSGRGSGEARNGGPKQILPSAGHPREAGTGGEHARQAGQAARAGAQRTRRVIAITAGDPVLAVSPA